MQDQTAGWAAGDVVPGVVADYAMELSCAVTRCAGAASNPR
jgi:hypothetical protein